MNNVIKQYEYQHVTNHQCHDYDNHIIAIEFTHLINAYFFMTHWCQHSQLRRDIVLYDDVL